MKFSKYFISLLLMIFTILLGCSKENYTITFCYEDQSIYKTIKVNSSEVVELDNLFKEGYVFIGWYNNDNKVESPVRFFENTKLVARFVEENHNHIFIDGVCFFSFYCFNQINLNSSNIAHQGLQLLKNEYWKNKVDIPKTRASRYE